MPDTTRHTLGLIGYPLTHSFSATYFAEKFKKVSLRNRFSYLNFELQDIAELPGLINRDKTLLGLNVTIPFKESVLPYLHTLSPEAEEIGAVNTLLIDRSTSGTVKLSGDNTDWIGFRDSLLEFIDSAVLPDEALVLGTGGSSKAIQYVLKKLSIPFQLVSRQQRPNETHIISYSDLTLEKINHARLIINTTPVGMHPKTLSAPDIPYEALSSQHYLFDLIYNPEETLFLRKGRASGAHTKNGLQMLRLQADASWKLWESSI